MGMALRVVTTGNRLKIMVLFENILWKFRSFFGCRPDDCDICNGNILLLASSQSIAMEGKQVINELQK